MNRRELLALTGGAGTLALAGCSALVDGGDDEDETRRRVLTGSVVGSTATVGGAGEGVEGELSIAAALDIDAAYVRVRQAGTVVEVLTDDLGTDELRAALGEADYEVQRVSDGVSEATRAEVVDALEAQLAAADVDGEVRFEDGSLVVEAADEDVASELTTDPETVAIELSYPGSEGNERRRETVLTGADFEEVSDVQEGRTGPEVLVRLSDLAAERFAARLLDTGFTATGTNACDFDPDREDDPTGEQYCVLTTANGEVVTAASLDPGLAHSVENGGFAREGAFVIRTAGDEQEAEELAAVLSAGLPPAEVRLEEI